MIRFILRLFNIRDFEPCKSCEILKQQLIFVNDEKRQLTETLLRIVNPKTVESATPIEMNQVAQSSALFSRRRAALEAKDREEAKILRGSTHLGRPDDNLKNFNSSNEVKDLEKELGVEEGV